MTAVLRCPQPCHPEERSARDLQRGTRTPKGSLAALGMTQGRDDTWDDPPMDPESPSSSPPSGSGRSSRLPPLARGVLRGAAVRGARGLRAAAGEPALALSRDVGARRVPQSRLPPQPRRRQGARATPRVHRRRRGRRARLARRGSVRARGRRDRGRPRPRAARRAVRRAARRPPSRDAVDRQRRARARVAPARRTRPLAARRRPLQSVHPPRDLRGPRRLRRVARVHRRGHGPRPPGAPARRARRPRPGRPASITAAAGFPAPTSRSAGAIASRRGASSWSAPASTRAAASPASSPRASRRRRAPRSSARGSSCRRSVSTRSGPGSCRSRSGGATPRWCPPCPSRSRLHHATYFAGLLTGIARGLAGAAAR